MFTLFPTDQDKIFALVFLVILGVNLMTLCPTVYWKDAGELTSAVSTLGICHPSGYPVYTIVGFFFSKLPVGDIGFRLNLVSAIFGALASAVIFRFLISLGLSVAGAVMGAFFTGLTHEIWLESSVTEIYTFSIFLIVLSMFFITGKTFRSLALGLFFLGLSLAHHLSTLLLSPAILVLGIRHLRTLDMRRLMILVLVFILGISSLCYLPIRSSADPLINFGEPNTLERLGDHYFTRHYSAKMWPETLEPIVQRLTVITRLLIKQSGISVFFLGIVGIGLAVSRPKLRWFVILFIGAHGAFLLYPPDHSFLIPLIFLIAILAALTCDKIVGAILRFPNVSIRLKLTVVILLIFGISGFLFINNLAHVSKNRHYHAWKLGKTLLRDLPESSMIVTNGDNGYSLVRYLQVCENRRPDVIHFHRPTISWPGELDRLQEKYPSLFGNSETRERELTPGQFIKPGEAASDQDFNNYMRILNQIMSKAVSSRSVSWELGSDTTGYQHYLSPGNLYFQFLSEPDGPFKFISHNTQEIPEDLWFFLDHNAVSEYAIILYNQASFQEIQGNQEKQIRLLYKAKNVWMRQHDRQPHNEIVEGMGRIFQNL